MCTRWEKLNSYSSCSCLQSPTITYWLFTTKNKQWHLWIEIILLVAWMIMNHVCLKCNLTSTAFSEALWNASDIIVGCSPLLSKLRHCFSKAPAKTTTAQPKYSSTFSHHAHFYCTLHTSSTVKSPMALEFNSYLCKLRNPMALGNP